MARNNNRARRSVATSLVVRTECVLLDTMENIQLYGIDLKRGTGAGRDFRRADLPYRNRAMEEFHDNSGLAIDVSGTSEDDLSRAFQRLATMMYHVTYHGDLEKLRRRRA